MGNNIDKYCEKSEGSDSRSTISKGLRLFRASKAQKPRHHDNESFIIEYSQTYAKHAANAHANDIDASLQVQPRVVFVSLFGAYKTWDKCPPHVLHSALFLMPLRKAWVYNPSENRNQLPSEFVCGHSWLSDVEETQKFIQLLKWKDSQGLVFWMLDDYDRPALDDTVSSDFSNLVHPLWLNLSEKLCGLYDAVHQSTYNGLKVFTNDWMRSFESKYGMARKDVLVELYFAPHKFKSVQEIIFMSNPNALDPIVYYQEHNVQRKYSSVSVFDDVSTDENDPAGNWWIADDYDPDN